MQRDAQVNLKEIVMGVHWHAQRSGASAGQPPANLDAQCVMFDEQGCVLEVVHRGHLRNANDSVVHTGDSPSGAREWHDERIFVFLQALPDSVSALAFLVSSMNGQVFSEVPGASCHLSDRLTEREWLRLDLTALGSSREHRIAMLRRGPAGWRMSIAEAPDRLHRLRAGSGTPRQGRRRGEAHVRRGLSLVK